MQRNIKLISFSEGGDKEGSKSLPLKVNPFIRCFLQPFLEDISRPDQSEEESLAVVVVPSGCAVIHRPARPCGTSVMGMSSRTGEPAVLFLPSHVRGTVQQRMLKEEAIINFAELVSERLVLFSGPGSLAPRGQHWPLSFQGKHCIRLSRVPRCRASKSVFVRRQNRS